MVQTALRIESPALSSAHMAPYAVSRPSGVDITDRSLWSWLLERPSSPTTQTRTAHHDEGDRWPGQGGGVGPPGTTGKKLPFRHLESLVMPSGHQAACYVLAALATIDSRGRTKVAWCR